MSKRCSTAMQCGTAIDVKELANALVVREKSTGCVFIKINLKKVTDCNDFEQVISCGSQFKFEDLAKMAATIDDCGRIVINVAYEEA